jgi:hypothetical protein
MTAVSINYIYIFYGILYCNIFRNFKEANIRHCKIFEDILLYAKKKFLLSHS